MKKIDIIDGKCVKDNNYIYTGNISSIKNPRPYMHTFYAFLYIAHNSGQLIIEGKSVNVTEGDIFLINSNIPYFFKPYSSSHSVGLYYCYFYRDIYPGAFSDMERSFKKFADFCNRRNSYIHTSDNHNKEFRASFIKMIDEFLYHLPGYLYSNKCRLISTLTDFLRREENGENNETYHPNKIVDQIMHNIEYLIYSKIALKDLAKQESITPEYMCAIFKKYTGMTITQYTNSLRIEKIKDLLISTSRPVNMILNKFDMNPVYLKRIFKQSTGYTMKEYRDSYGI